MGERIESMKDLSAFAALKDIEKKDVSDCINKIMNTLSFRKLAGKTQVILSLSGPDVRTRLTHTIEVAKIARDICHKLGLNEDLAEAIALAHDIGHTPFGHVGERTLREILCGCDTLNGKIRDLDFKNSGFKHNLQSFRILRNIEKIPVVDEEKTWHYILWGVIVHSSPTYVKKPNIKMDNEIYISCEHCVCVYNCHFSPENRGCKRNEGIRSNKNENSKARLCKPWYCSDIEDSNEWKNSNTFCAGENKCYLAQLWKHKKDNLNYERFKYLFDHPFPNSFYAEHFSDFFFNDNNFTDCVSVEAQIINKADEIAQRQQDLEDGVSKKLLLPEEAKDHVNRMFKEFQDDRHIETECIAKLNSLEESDANFSNKLGKILVDFYIHLITFSTLNNFDSFCQPVKELKKIKISYYCLLKILNQIKGAEEKDWLLSEIEDFVSHDKSSYQENLCDKQKAFAEMFEDHFEEIDPDEFHLFFLIYDFLENETKTKTNLDLAFSVWNSYKDILTLKTGYSDNHDEDESIEEKAILILNIEYVKSHLKKKFPAKYEIYRYHKKNSQADTPWKKLIDLSLLTFDKLDLFVTGQDSSTILTCTTIKKGLIENHRELPDIFKRWKTVLKLEANQKISSLVRFLPENKNQRVNLKDSLDYFKSQQADIILKSEIVEKNDGKASYILKRLFKAYITNTHQLPDLCLRNILINMMHNKEKLKEKAIETFDELLNGLKASFPSNDSIEERMLSIAKKFKQYFRGNGVDNDLDEVIPKEIRDLQNEGKELKEFIDKLDLGRLTTNNSYAKEKLREFRRYLDNPLLNAISYWKSILTRGICDYIAGMTDQEAINEYEKLYAGNMELA
jgi:putative nucleotidyltransferase with HDIG domain